MIPRRKSLVVSVGDVKIGGNNPISIQSMITTKPSNIEESVKKIKELEKAGCEIIRIAVPTMKDAKALKKIKSAINIPLVADIHFDYKLAIESIKSGVDKLRINPGNIGKKENVKKIVKLAKSKNIPIRIGVNSGSLEKSLIKKYGKVCPEAIVESALKHIEILEDLDFRSIIVSLKSSDILQTIESYKLLAKKCNYPFHIGITEAGTLFSGTVKSSVGIGSLLLMGLGDTLRVSLTSDPIEEIKVGKEILKSLNLRGFGPKIISCPTCGRCNVNLEKIANKVQNAVMDLKTDITIAIMGCGVNGPGEAKEADIGIAGGKKEFIIFKKGQVVKKIDESEVIEYLLKEINKMRD